MYLAELFPDLVELGDTWVLTVSPLVTARIFPTSFEGVDLPKFFFSVEAVLLDGVKDTAFIHRYLTMMNSNYHYVKITAQNSGKRLAIGSEITIPADDLQQKEIVFAVFMTASIATQLPSQIRAAIKTKSLE
jgi:hypothetical protein